MNSVSFGSVSSRSFLIDEMNSRASSSIFYRTNELFRDFLAPYILSNESGREPIIAQLEQQKPLEGAHLGFACMFNYDIIAARRPTYAYICDTQPELLTFYLDVSILIADSKSRFDFVEKMKRFLDAYPEFDNGDLMQGAALDAELVRSGSWLSTDAKFNTIKELHLQKKVYYRNLDITDTEVFARDFFKIRFQTVYASNIRECLANQSFQECEKYNTNMNQVVDSQTFFIDAFYLTKDKSNGSPLRMTQGHLPSFRQQQSIPRSIRIHNLSEYLGRKDALLI